MQTTPPAAAEAAEVMLRAGIEDEANAPAEAGKANAPAEAEKADTPKEAGTTVGSEFLGLWESLHNPNFNRVQFNTFRTEAGLNRFVMTPSKWIELTGAIGITTKPGRNK